MSVDSHNDELGVSSPTSTESTPVASTQVSAEPVYQSRRERRLAEAAAEQGVTLEPAKSEVVAVATPALAVAMPAPAPEQPVVPTDEKPVASAPAETSVAVVAPEAIKKVRTPKSLLPSKLRDVSKPPRAKRPTQTKPELTPARRRGRMVSLVAMAFIAGLAVATSVPANALLTQSQIIAIANGYSEDGYIGVQDITAADGTVASGRDKVSGTQWGGVTGGGIFSNVTYVNDPMGTIQWPIRETVHLSDLYGIRPNPFGSGYTFHHGIDFLPGYGHPIQAIADGTVSQIVEDPYGGLGYYVVIDHNVEGMVFQSLYGHLKAGSIRVKVGQKVHVTDVIAECGDTGESTGSHLHFGILIDGQTVDPLAWLKKYTN